MIATTTSTRMIFPNVEPKTSIVIAVRPPAPSVSALKPSSEIAIVPNRIIVPALVAALVVRTILDPSVVWIVSALAAGGFFLLAALVYPAGLGMGDVKLAAFLGAWLGPAVSVALFAGCLLAMIPAVVILATQGKEARKVGIPFAPFLAGGGVIALFFGGRLVDWWLG